MRSLLFLTALAVPTSAFALEAAKLEPGVTAVPMPDGSVVKFLKVDDAYDPTDRVAVMGKLKTMQDQGLVPTGLLYIEESATDMHVLNRTVKTPLVDVPYEALCPGSGALEELMTELR